MIVKENIKIGGRAFVKMYSDGGFYIERDGEKYSEAIDLADIPRTYTETDEPVEYDGEELTVSDTLGMLSEMGVKTTDD